MDDQVLQMFSRDEIKEIIRKEIFKNLRVCCSENIIANVYWDNILIIRGGSSDKIQISFGGI